jgi:chromosome segregation ATPase
MLAIGVCMQIHVLSIITCICVVLYTLISLSLDDHHQAAQKSNESFKEGVNALTKMLGAIFLELDELAKKLAVSVDTLSEENKRFGANNTTLLEQLATLQSELNQLKTTSTELKLTSDQLKETNMGLEKEVTSLQQEVNQLNTTTKKLRVLTESFAALLARGEEAERAFKDKFDENIKAMQAGHQSFADAIESIFSVNESLQKLKADLEAGALRNEVLLEKYHNLLTVHEARATFGLYAKGAAAIPLSAVSTGLEIRTH